MIFSSSLPYLQKDLICVVTTVLLSEVAVIPWLVPAGFGGSTIPVLVLA